MDIFGVSVALGDVKRSAQSPRKLREEILEQTVPRFRPDHDRDDGSGGRQYQRELRENRRGQCAPIHFWNPPFPPRRGKNYRVKL